MNLNLIIQIVNASDDGICGFCNMFCQFKFIFPGIRKSKPTALFAIADKQDKIVEQ